MGGSLIRSIALVEQAPQPLPNERVLSLLKMLRDDLRQVIDQGSSAGAQGARDTGAMGCTVAPPFYAHLR